VSDRYGYTHVEVSGRTLRLRQMDTAGARYDELELTKPVTAADPLLSFAGAAAPPRGWREADSRATPRQRASASPGGLLRAGRNALAIEGFARSEAARSSLELVLLSSAPR